MRIGASRNRSDEKIKKGKGGPPALSLTENPDILKTIASRKAGGRRLVVGFAAETEHVIEHAADKLARKGCDLIVANDVSAESGVFGGDHNKVHLVSPSGVESWPDMSKDEVADKLMEHLAVHAASSQEAAR